MGAARHNLGLSKKAGLPDFGSIDATCNIQFEADHGLLANDLTAASNIRPSPAPRHADASRRGVLDGGCTRSTPGMHQSYAFRAVLRSYDVHVNRGKPREATGQERARSVPRGSTSALSQAGASGGGARWRLRRL